MATSPNRAKAPAILTEYSPSGAGGVAYAWDVIWPSDGMAGAFLFQWQDQGMTDKFPERWPVHSPGAPPASYVPGSATAVDGDSIRRPRRPACALPAAPTPSPLIAAF